MQRSALDTWIMKAEGLNELTRAGIEDLQLAKLNALLRKMRERGGFYAGLPEKLGSLAELAALPLTTPKDLAARPGAFLLRSQSEVGRVVSGSTSGTTGPNKRLFYTPDDLARTVGFFAAGISELVSAGEAVMIAMPFSGPNGLGELIARAVESLGARPLRTGVGRPLGELREELARECPAAYIGMPVPLLGMLRYAGAGSLKRALISADACPKTVCAHIEGILGSRLYPHYGSREMCLGGAVTCPAHEGMHLRENHVIAEILSPAGAPLPPGESGELVITTIGMEAMPLIRYRTGDVTSILPEPCPCGSPTARLAPVRRMGEEDLPARLDDLLFDCPAVVDVRCSVAEDEVEIAVVTLPGQGFALPEGVKQLFPGKKIALSLEEAGEGYVMTPFKRTLQRA